MHVIMGGTGHVGAAVAWELLRRGERVAIVTRSPGKADALRAAGADVIAADVTDVDALRAAFRRGRRAFLLNPPADVATDTDVVERRTVAAILAALTGSGLEKVVAASTIGARRGERLGDLSVLWELEEGLRHQAIPAAINRAGYYMSNWDAMLATARDTGKLPSFLPADFSLPMVAPEDVGRAAVERLLSPIDDIGVRNVEGPTPVSPVDVAASFGRALGRPVTVTETPREEWRAAYLALGFSEVAAESYCRMTALCLEEGFASPAPVIRGTTTLQTYVARLVRP